MLRGGRSNPRLYSPPLLEVSQHGAVGVDDLSFSTQCYVSCFGLERLRRPVFCDCERVLFVVAKGARSVFEGVVGRKRGAMSKYLPSGRIAPLEEF